MISHAPGCPPVLQRVADAIDDGRWFDEHPQAATRIRRPSAAELAELRVLADVDTADISELRIRCDDPHVHAHVFDDHAASGWRAGRYAGAGRGFRPSARPAPPRRLKG